MESSRKYRSRSQSCAGVSLGLFPAAATTGAAVRAEPRQRLAQLAANYVRQRLGVKVESELSLMRATSVVDEFAEEIRDMELSKLEKCLRSKWASILSGLSSDRSPREALKQALKEDMIFDIICPASIKVRKGATISQPSSANKKSDLKKRPAFPELIIKTADDMKHPSEETKAKSAAGPKRLLEEEEKRSQQPKKDTTHLKFPLRIVNPQQIPHPFSVVQSPPALATTGRKRVFAIVGPYQDVRAALLRRGWVENLDPESNDFDLKWTLKLKELRHEYLRPGQLANHFQGAVEVSTKVGLMHNLKNLAWIANLDTDTFHPLAYDMADVEVADFVEEFKLMKAESMLRSFVEAKKSLKDFGAAKLIVSIWISERRLARVSQLGRTHVESLVPDSEWDLLTCHRTAEAKLLKDKYSGLGKRIAKYQLTRDEPAVHRNVDEILAELQARYPQYSINGSRNIWIAKPAGLSRGRGINVLSDLKRILEFTRGKHYIVQKYIENPLIVSNRKVCFPEGSAIIVRHAAVGPGHQLEPPGCLAI